MAEENYTVNFHFPKIGEVFHDNDTIGDVKAKYH